MFDYTFNYIYGILGYQGWAWYFRILALFAIPFVSVPLIAVDIIVLIIRTIIGIYQDI